MRKLRWVEDDPIWEPTLKALYAIQDLPLRATAVEKGAMAYFGLDAAPLPQIFDNAKAAKFTRSKRIVAGRRAGRDRPDRPSCIA